MAAKVALRMGVWAPSFRPPEAICQLRSLLCHRENLLPMTVKHMQPMPKALDQMPLHLPHVISDIPGVTGRACSARLWPGYAIHTREPTSRDDRIQIQPRTPWPKRWRGMTGPTMFSRFTPSLALHDFMHTQLAACDQEIEACPRPL